MSSNRKRVAALGERRSNPRRPISIPGSAVSLLGSKSVVIEDLSVDGAKLLGRDLPAVGKQVLIWTEGLDVLGSVAWSRFGEGGVVFDDALDSRIVTNLEQEAEGSLFSFSQARSHSPMA